MGKTKLFNEEILGQKNHVFHVFNQHTSLLITSMLNDQEYVLSLAKKYLVRECEATPEELENLQCEYHHFFERESIMNLDYLNNTRSSKCNNC